MIGLMIIKEMTREELIEEIITVYTMQLEKQDMGQLKVLVANARISNYRETLLKEAGLKDGILGTVEADSTEEDTDG